MNLFMQSWKIHYRLYASLAITGAIKVSSTEKIFEELGLETLKSRRWYRKMSFLYKVLKNESPSYLFQNIPNAQRQSHRQTKIQEKFLLLLSNMTILRILFSLRQ